MAVRTLISASSVPYRVAVIPRLRDPDGSTSVQVVKAG